MAPAQISEAKPLHKRALVMFGMLSVFAECERAMNPDQHRDPLDHDMGPQLDMSENEWGG